MKKISLAILAIACTLLCASPTYADPHFSDDNWNKIFEGKEAKLPKTMPEGKGMVSTMNLAGRQQIVKPYDMKKDAYIQLSDYAVDAKKYYASQTQKDFLEATAKELRKLSGNKSIKLPVSELGYDTFEFPIHAARSASLEVEFGWFATQNDKPVVLPRGHYASKSDKINVRNQSLMNMDHAVSIYIDNCTKQMAELKKLDRIELNKKLQEIFKDARETAKKQNRFKKSQPSAADQSLLEEKWARIEAREQAGDAGWDPQFNGGDALADEREERKAKIKARKKNKTNKRNTDDDYRVDIAQTWNLIEAMVTQTAVPVARLQIPLAIEEVLLLHAKTNKRPEALIKRIMELNIKTKASGGNISVKLACSTRDRFMGCSNIAPYYDDAQEAEIVKITENLEKQLTKADSTQKQILNTLLRNIKEVRMHDSTDEGFKMEDPSPKTANGNDALPF